MPGWNDEPGVNLPPGISDPGNVEEVSAREKRDYLRAHGWSLDPEGTWWMRCEQWGHKDGELPIMGLDAAYERQLEIDERKP